jgi:hypothetical protein
MRSKHEPFRGSRHVARDPESIWGSTSRDPEADHRPTGCDRVSVIPVSNTCMALMGDLARLARFIIVVLVIGWTLPMSYDVMQTPTCDGDNWGPLNGKCI